MKVKELQLLLKKQHSEDTVLIQVNGQYHKIESLASTGYDTVIACEPTEKRTCFGC